MTSDEPPDAPVPTVMEVELTTEEAAVVGVMRGDDRSRAAILRYALAFNG